ncbi:MAG: replication-associated recombination protein A [Chloroflexi bacterium]|nr:replication-associated recombination protein A [Chloroflexota bacterium]
MDPRLGRDMFERETEAAKTKDAPLATRMRPAALSDYIGQEHIVGEGRVLRKAIESDHIPSMILWGPPGSGKTTLARIIASTTGANFAQVSAVSATVADLRRIIEQAKELHKQERRTILFIDEIHRFNKAQQDVILPYVEDGTLTLIGATTENPSFEVTSPLLSRARVLTLKPLNPEELKNIILRALKDRVRGLGELNVELPAEVMDYLIRMANSDARIALNMLEIAAFSTPPEGPEGARRVVLQTMEDVFQHRAVRYDRAGDRHYDVISAFIKSLRGSDPDAALYWLAVMLEAGEDPLFIARRMVILASEDVGLADPRALLMAVAAQQAVHFVGLPEGSLVLAESALYLATAPKSNSVLMGLSRAQEEVKSGPNNIEVPLHLRNPVTPLMKKLGYGRDYRYAHNYPGHYAAQVFLPPGLAGKKFYQPGELGYEAQVAERLKAWREKGRGAENPG